MQHIDCKIQLHDPRITTLQRKNDTFIMDTIINIPYVENKHWEICNGCRIYTKALFVSDISSTNGTHLAHVYYNDKPPDRLMSEPSQDWLQQGRPNSASWKIYTGLLTKILCGADGRLQKTLGKWLQDDAKWNWQMSSNKETLFHRHHQEWFEHKLIHQKRTKMIFKGHSTKVILPNNTVPVPEVVQKEDTITCTQGCNIKTTLSKPTTPPTTFNEYIEYENSGKLTYLWDNKY
eukprot:13009359-Ditylum_brightwellii.AAC.1